MTSLALSHTALVRAGTNPNLSLSFPSDSAKTQTCENSDSAQTRTFWFVPALIQQSLQLAGFARTRQRDGAPQRRHRRVRGNAGLGLRASGCEALATSSKSTSTSISRRSATTRLLRAHRQRKNCIRRSHATSRATTAPIGAACDCNALQRSDSPHAAAARDREVRGTRHAARRRRRG